jgi:hypothetical protein
MQLNETKELLKEVAAVDNRKIEPETLQVWHGYLQHIRYDVAKEALRLARLDDRVSYLEPKNIISWVSQAGHNIGKSSSGEIPTKGICVHRMDVQFCQDCCAKAGRSARKPDPQPNCRDHGMPLLSCNACCKTLWKYTQANGFEGLHAFAKKNIYA